MLPLFAFSLFLKHFVVGENYFLNIYNHQKINNFDSTHITQTIVQCGTLCTNSDNYSSANYNSATGECQLSDVSKWNINGHIEADADWTVLVIESEKTLGAACEVTSDCLERNSLCIQKRCFCNYTAVYNPQTGGCDIECYQYSSDFHKYERKAISSYNIDRIDSITVQECMEVCVEMFGFSCGSIDYSAAAQRCMINQLNYQQVQDVEISIMRDDDGFDVYSRHC